MGRSKIYALFGAALFALPAAEAIAADIPEVPPPVEFHGNWYLRGYIGMANQSFKGLDHPLFAEPAFFEWLDRGNFDAVPLFGVGIGYRHSDHLRFDLTGEYRGKSSFNATDRYATEDEGDIGGPVFDGDDNLWGTNQYRGRKSEWLFLANGYYDFNSWHGVTPYVGAGIGMSYNSIYGFVDDNIQTAGKATAPTGHQWQVAWALHAGASMQVTNNLALDLGYSFVHLGDAQTGIFENVAGCQSDPCVPMKFKGLYSHDLKLGVRWSYDTPAQSYYPPVVKY
jgi:opacity protein-like surface antigen